MRASKSQTAASQRQPELARGKPQPAKGKSQPDAGLSQPKVARASLSRLQPTKNNQSQPEPDLSQQKVARASQSSESQSEVGFRLPEPVRCRPSQLEEPEPAVPKGIIFVVPGFEPGFSGRPARSLIRENKEGRTLKTEDTRTYNYHHSVCKTIVLELA